MINPSNNKETSQNFLVDTGASITILGGIKYKSFLQELQPVDQILIQYGSGFRKRINVYEVFLMLYGERFEILAAYDDKLNFTHSLLGNCGFMDQFRSVVVNYNVRETKLIRYY